MDRPNHKYSIQALLYARPHKEYKQALADLQDLLEISRSQLNRIRFCPPEGSPSHSFASAEQVQKIAEYFGVSTDDILNPNFEPCATAK